MTKVIAKSKEHPHLWGARWGIFNAPKPPPGVPWYPLDGGEDYFHTYGEAAEYIESNLPSADALMFAGAEEPPEQHNMAGETDGGEKYRAIIWRL